MKFILFMMVFAFAPLPVLAATKNIYMATFGQDSNDGSHYSNSPVRSLGRAIQLAKNHFNEGNDVVQILIRPGQYFVGEDQPATRSYIVDLKMDLLPGLSDAAGKTLIIQTHKFSTQPFARAIIDGRKLPTDQAGNVCGFIKIESTAAQALPRVMIRGLELHYMNNPVNIINGSRHEVVGNRFIRIGNTYSCTQNIGYAAVTLYASSQNRIVGNDFHLVSNDGEHASGVHPIYAYKGSTQNEIAGNSFYQFTGSAVKIRDRSDYNIVKMNNFYHFVDSGNPRRAVQAVYYQAAGNECPSRGSKITDNFFVYNPLPQPNAGFSYFGTYSHKGSADPSTCLDSNRAGMDALQLDISNTNQEFLSTSSRPFLVRSWFSDIGFNFDFSSEGQPLSKNDPVYGFCPAATSCAWKDPATQAVTCAASGQKIGAYTCDNNNFVQ